MGAGTKIWHFCHVLGGAVIGERCSFGQNVVVMNGTRIGNNVKVQNNVSIYEGVELEDDVFCGPSMVFTNVLNPRAHVSRRHEYQKTLVRRGCQEAAPEGLRLKIHEQLTVTGGVTAIGRMADPNLLLVEFGATDCELLAAAVDSAAAIREVARLRGAFAVRPLDVDQPTSD